MQATNKANKTIIYTQIQPHYAISNASSIIWRSDFSLSS